MLKFILKKILQMIPMLLFISFLVFGTLQLTGIDPVSYIATPDMAKRQFDRCFDCSTASRNH